VGVGVEATVGVAVGLLVGVDETVGVEVGFAVEVDVTVGVALVLLTVTLTVELPIGVVPLYA
jgi:hypothetical protein